MKLIKVCVRPTKLFVDDITAFLEERNDAVAGHCGEGPEGDENGSLE